MKPIFPLLSIILLFAYFQSTGQSFEVPRNFDAKNTSTYSNYNKDVVNCINWLENTPVNMDTIKRKAAMTFFIEWISGSPDVSISLNARVATFGDNNPVLLINYMGGWTRYAIESGNYKDSLGGNLAGIRSVIKVYKANKSLNRDNSVEKLIALDDKGELEKWEAEQMKAQ